MLERHNAIEKNTEIMCETDERRFLRGTLE